MKSHGIMCELLEKECTKKINDYPKLENCKVYCDYNRMMYILEQDGKEIYCAPTIDEIDMYIFIKRQVMSQEKENKK